MRPHTLLGSTLQIFILIRSALQHQPVPKRPNDAFTATKDFVFRATPREDIVYDPSYVTVVKQVDLSPMRQAIEVLEGLIKRYNDSCSMQSALRPIPWEPFSLARIPGKALTVTKGVELCKQLGGKFKLLELQQRDEATFFLSKVFFYNPGSCI